MGLQVRRVNARSVGRSVIAVMTTPPGFRFLTTRADYSSRVVDGGLIGLGEMGLIDSFPSKPTVHLHPSTANRSHVAVVHNLGRWLEGRNLCNAHLYKYSCPP